MITLKRFGRQELCHLGHNFSPSDVSLQQTTAKPKLLFGIGDTVRPMVGVLVLEAAGRDGKRVVYARRVGLTCCFMVLSRIESHQKAA